MSLLPETLAAVFVKDPFLKSLCLNFYRNKILPEKDFPPIKTLLCLFNKYQVFKEEDTHVTIDELVKFSVVFIKNIQTYNTNEFYFELKNIMFRGLEGLQSHPSFYNNCTCISKELMEIDVIKGELLVVSGLELVLLLTTHSRTYPWHYIASYFTRLIDYSNSSCDDIACLSIKIMINHLSECMKVVRSGTSLLETLDQLVQFISFPTIQEKHLTLVISVYTALCALKLRFIGMDNLPFDIKRFQEKTDSIDTMFAMYLDQRKAFFIDKCFGCSADPTITRSLFVLTILGGTGISDKIKQLYLNIHSTGINQSTMIETTLPQDLKWIKEALVVTLDQAIASRIPLDDPLYERLVESIEGMYENRMHVEYFAKDGPPADVLAIDFEFINSVWKLYYFILRTYSGLTHTLFVSPRVIPTTIGGAWRLAKFIRKHNPSGKLPCNYLRKALLPTIKICLQSNKDYSNGCQLLMELLLKNMLASGKDIDVTMCQVTRMQAPCDDTMEKVCEILDLYLRAQRNHALRESILSENTLPHLKRRGGFAAARTGKRSKFAQVDRRSIPRLWARKQTSLNLIAKHIKKQVPLDALPHETNSTHCFSHRSPERSRANDQPKTYPLISNILSWDLAALLAGDPLPNHYASETGEPGEDAYCLDDYVTKHKKLLYLEIWASLNNQVHEQIAKPPIPGKVSDLHCIESHAFLKITLDSTLPRELEEDNLVLFSLQSSQTTVQTAPETLAIVRSASGQRVCLKCEFGKLASKGALVTGMRIRIKQLIK